MREISIKGSVFDGLMALLEDKNGVDLSGFYEDTDRKESVAIALLLLNKRNVTIQPRIFISDMNSTNATVAILIGESLLTGECTYVKLRFNFAFSENGTCAEGVFFKNNGDVAIDTQMCPYSEEAQKKYGGEHYEEMRSYISQHVNEFYNVIFDALAKHGNKTYLRNFSDGYKVFPELEN